MITNPINIVNRDDMGKLVGFNKMHYNNGSLNYKGTLAPNSPQTSSRIMRHIGYWEWGRFNGHIYEKIYFIR